MIWQDVALTVANLSFSIALLPSVFSEHKPALATSLMTTAGLIVIAVSFVTLSLWLSTAIVILNALIWLTLAFQVIFQRHSTLKR